LFTTNVPVPANVGIGALMTDMGELQQDLLPYQVFISYAKEDTKTALAFHEDLTSVGIRPWIDVRQLSTGANWELGIKKAIRECPYILVLLSPRSVGKRGYVQKEIREALDIADTVPDDEVFILPVRLESCVVPDRLKKWQWCDAFRPEERQRLLHFLKSRLGIDGFPLLKEQEHELRLTLAPDLIANTLLFSKFTHSLRILRSRTQKVDLYVSNGHCLEVRRRSTRFIQLFDETFPHCEKRDADFFGKVIPSQEKYKSAGKVVSNVDLLVDPPYAYRLLSRDGTKCGIDRDYWIYITVKYPDAVVYLTDKLDPIVVEQDDTVRFVVMPLRLL
jgi:hypothetical protein